MNLATLMVAALFAALALGCGGSTTTISEVAAPDAVRCQTSVANPPGTVPHAGSQINLTVVADRECTWSARSEAAWAQVAPASGQGQATVALTVAANPNAATRSGSIVVNDMRLSLTQEAAPCRFQLGSARNQMSHEGGRTSVTVTAPSGCAWRAASNFGWARVLTDSGTGSGTVEIEVSANASTERAATITIADQTMTVVQAGRPTELPQPGPGPAPPPPNPGCSISLDSSERSFGAAGGESSFRVIAPEGCAWTATASPWIDLSGSSGTGTDTIKYKVPANTSTSPRTGAITVAGRTHTVRQEGLVVAGGGGGGGGSGGGGGGEEQRVELSGRVVWFEGGSCPSIGFVIQGRRVFTNGETRFRGGECRNIRLGSSLRVEGRVQSDGRVRATEVRIRDDDDDDDNH